MYKKNKTVGNLDERVDPHQERGRREVRVQVQAALYSFQNTVTIFIYNIRNSF